MQIETSAGPIEAILQRPANAQWLYVLAHGAGAGMKHRFMQDIADRLENAGIATLRYEYPYMTAGKGRPPQAAQLEAQTRAVVAWAASEYPDLRLIAGGKSMGGRMTSRAQSESPLDRVEGLVFLGFPLHNPGSPSTERAEHLTGVKIPMLFLQGTRDTLAQLDLITQVTDAHPNAKLHIIDTADHSFAVLKKSGMTNAQALDAMVHVMVDWLDTL